MRFPGNRFFSFISRWMFSALLALFFFVAKNASAQGSVGSAAPKTDDPVTPVVCHRPDSYDVGWVDEQLKKVITEGEHQADLDKCDKTEGSKHKYSVKLNHEEYEGYYILMRVHNNCQLSDAWVDWKRAPKKVSMDTNGNLPCGCKIDEYFAEQVAHLTFSNDLLRGRYPNPKLGVVPLSRTRALTLQPSRLVEGNCPSKTCKIQAPEQIVVEENFSSLSLTLAEVVRDHYIDESWAPPAPVCKREAKRYSPVTENVCAEEFGRTNSQSSPPTVFTYTVSVPDGVAFFAHLDRSNPRGERSVPIELCSNKTGQQLSEPTDENIWSISSIAPEEYYGPGGTQNFQIRFIGPEPQIATGQ